MLETLLGKLLAWIPAPWSGVRLGHEASARLCTDGHPVVWFVGGAEQPWPRGPLHIDVALRLWSRTGDRTTVRDMAASAAGQRLHPYQFREMTLESGAKPEQQWPRLEPPDGEPLRAGAGDTVAVELLLTRGRMKKLKVRIEPAKED